MLNYQLCDFSEDTQHSVWASVVHNDSRVRWVHFKYFLTIFRAVTDVLVDGLSTRRWLQHEGELGVIKCVTILGDQELLCHNMAIFINIHSSQISPIIVRISTLI